MTVGRTSSRVPLRHGLASTTVSRRPVGGAIRGSAALNRFPRARLARDERCPVSAERLFEIVRAVKIPAWKSRDGHSTRASLNMARRTCYAGRIPVSLSPRASYVYTQSRPSLPEHDRRKQFTNYLTHRYQYRKWCLDGTRPRINRVLCGEKRTEGRRDPEPTGAIPDS